METVFIITRYEADEKHTDAANLSRARNACMYAMEDGLAPVCPRLFFTRDIERDSYESARYAEIIEALIGACDIVRQYGASVDGRMSEELAVAERLGKPVEIFNGIGIPKKDWNSVKFADDPDYQKACAEAGKTL